MKAPHRRRSSREQAPQSKRPAARTKTRARISIRLLDWYDGHRRDLPWRYAPGVAADPYRVWLSEIMLQQTVVKAVIPFFETFTVRWPTVRDLAAANLDDVLAAWAGLGYYSRARNLHAAATIVARDYHGAFPRDEATLRRLPGVGPYTAAAIAAIAHGLKATPVDGNVERVVSRLFAVDTPLPDAKAELRLLAQDITPEARAGDFAQAMMDLGATVCTPRNPSCTTCPLASACDAKALDVADALPRKRAKAERPTRHGVAFVAVTRDGHVLLRKRPMSGLLAGLYDVPSTDWNETRPGGNAIEAARPFSAAFKRTTRNVVHIFTHFRLELSVEYAVVERTSVLPPLVWAPLQRLDEFALPTVVRKVMAAADLPLSTSRAIGRSNSTA